MARMTNQQKLLSNASRLGRPGPLKKKDFIPNVDLPVLDSYFGPLPDSYWDTWTKLRWEDVVHESWVNHATLWEVCSTAGVYDTGLLRNVCNYIENGALIGCRGKARWPTIGRNSNSVAEHGAQIMDAIQGWICDGICVGPLREDEMPFGEYTVSPLTTRQKPNGSQRIIFDLSSPHLDDAKLGYGVPLSINAGISKEEFETTMMSTKLWIQALMRGGVGYLMSKMDWSQADKHFHVNENDLPLQVFKVSNRYFIELRLVFGAVSSPALFDRPNWLIREAAFHDPNWLSNFMICVASPARMKGP